MIRVTRTLTLDESELDFTFTRASGPGGQNVNKVATVAQLRFDVFRSASLPESVRQRLTQLARRRMTKDGILVIDARRYRTQERNRRDAVERLVALIRRATVVPKRRRPTKPTAASRQQRLAEKRHRGAVKNLRRPPDERDG